MPKNSSEGNRGFENSLFQARISLILNFCSVCQGLKTDIQCEKYSSRICQNLDPKFDKSSKIFII
jgi:hypothetical protein